jgi:hypothetical protein
VLIYASKQSSVLATIFISENQYDFVFVFPFISLLLRFWTFLNKRTIKLIYLRYIYKVIFSKFNKIFVQKISDYKLAPLSSAEPYEFLVKLRNITWETNYVIVSQNALGMMGRRKLHFVNHRSHPPPRRAPLNVLYYPYIIPTNPI